MKHPIPRIEVAPSNGSNLDGFRVICGCGENATFAFLAHARGHAYSHWLYMMQKASSLQPLQKEATLMDTPTPIEAVIARLNTEAREAAIPLYFVVTGVRPDQPYGDPETKSAAELTDEDLAQLTGIEVHIAY